MKPLDIHLLGTGGGRFAMITQRRRTAGIRLVHGDTPRQLSLFHHQYRKQYRQALESVDSLRDRYGESVVTWGSLLRNRESI